MLNENFTVTAEDLNSIALNKFIHPNIEYTPGITAIVDFDNINKQNIFQMIEQNLLQFILITNDNKIYNDLSNKLIGTNNLVVYHPTKSVPELIRIAINKVNTSHLMFIQKNEQLIGLTDETLAELNDEDLILFKRYEKKSEDNYFNNIFKDKSEKSIILNESNFETEDEVTREKTDNIKKTHPFAIEITSADFDSKEEVENNQITYPIYSILKRLVVFTGIAFPTKFIDDSTFTNDESEQISEYKFVINFISHSKININYINSVSFFSDITLLTKESEYQKKTENIYILLKYLSKRLDYRSNDNIHSIIQSFANDILITINNSIDKGELSLLEVQNKFDSYEIQNINFEVLNKGNANKLVIAYCFPPYNDTSGNVMAKRIFIDHNISDIISNKMDKIRSLDFSLEKIAGPFVDTHFECTAPQAFSSWESIDSFVEQGLEIYNQFKEKYSELYSRAMFPASHFLGFSIKQSNPYINWTAEFSDPLHTDVASNIRYAPIKDESFLNEINKVLPVEYKELIDDNVFNLCELLPFAFADKLIFTNEYQLEYMIKRFSSNIQLSIRRRAVISQHPTLPTDFYHIKKSYYPINSTTINLAYFGNFYDTRGFREIELLCKMLVINKINNFKIHVFTKIDNKFISMYENSQFKKYIRVNSYVEFFEFLNLTDKMDGLLIFDAHTKGIKEMNPYLPSKLSDYLGSKAYTLAFVENGSILSKQENEKLLKVDMMKYHEYKELFIQLSEKIGKKLTI